MKEEVNIYDGRGVIHLKGSTSETFLYVKNKPRIASFHAEIGTIWRYQIGREISDNLIGENHKYEELVSSGEIIEEEKLSRQFNHITQLLTNGNYELHYCEFSWELNILPAIEKCNNKTFYDVYGGMNEITATQTYSNKDTIDKYKGKIKSGLRPVPVLIKIKDSCATYIIDGHHKLAAYKETKVNPKALIISKLEYKNNTLPEAIKEMKSLGMTDEKWIEIYKSKRV